MRKLAWILLIPASQGIALAHPGVGIVADSKGNIFFTDLSQVWLVSPDGKKTVAVPNVHTHELWIDTLDNLYGEHLWYEGDASGKWGHRVWKRSRDGVVTDVIPARVGFRDDYDDFHFVRDRAGNMYWADEDSVTVIRKRAPGGKVTDLARRTMRRAGAMTVSRAGTLFFIDGDDLLGVTPGGEVRTLARGLTADAEGHTPEFNRNAILGLWTDAADNVYMAVQERECVKKVDPRGNVTIADRSAAPWKPSGGLVAANGDRWILEFSIVNAVRARCIRSDGVTRIF